MSFNIIIFVFNVHRITSGPDGVLWGHMGSTSSRSVTMYFAIVCPWKCCFQDSLRCICFGLRFENVTNKQFAQVSASVVWFELVANTLSSTVPAHLSKLYGPCIPKPKSFVEIGWSIWFDLIRVDSIWFGSILFGSMWFDLISFDSICFDSI